MKTNVIKSGTRKDGSFWIQIQKEDDIFVLEAFLKTNKLIDPGTEVTIPASVVKNLAWK